MSRDWFGSAAEDVTTGEPAKQNDAKNKLEADAKKEAMANVKKNQDSALSTARARSAASGAAPSTLADYFTSVEKGFEKENAWLSSSKISSRAAQSHAKYYETQTKQKGFGFLQGADDEAWYL